MQLSKVEIFLLIIILVGLLLLGLKYFDEPERIEVAPTNNSSFNFR